LAFALCVLTFCSSCATPKKVKSGYNFNHVKRVALGTFQGAQGGGPVGQEFVRQLLDAGFIVTAQAQNADVVLSGTVTDFRPADKMLVFLGTATFPGPGGKSVEVTNPIVSGMAQTADATALALPKTQMVTESASVGVSAQLNDAQTKELVWSNAYSYEGLNMPSAIQTVARSLVRSIRRQIPGAAVAEHP